MAIVGDPLTPPATSSTPARARWALRVLLGVLFLGGFFAVLATSTSGAARADQGAPAAARPAPSAPAPSLRAPSSCPSALPPEVSPGAGCSAVGTGPLPPVPAVAPQAPAPVPVPVPVPVPAPAAAPEPVPVQGAAPVDVADEPDGGPSTGTAPRPVGLPVPIERPGISDDAAGPGARPVAPEPAADPDAATRPLVPAPNADPAPARSAATGGSSGTGAEVTVAAGVPATVPAADPVDRVPAADPVDRVPAADPADRVRPASADVGGGQPDRRTAVAAPAEVPDTAEPSVRATVAPPVPVAPPPPAPPSPLPAPPPSPPPAPPVPVGSCAGGVHGSSGGAGPGDGFDCERAVLGTSVAEALAGGSSRFPASRGFSVLADQSDPGDRPD